MGTLTHKITGQVVEFADGLIGTFLQDIGDAENWIKAGFEEEVAAVEASQPVAEVIAVVEGQSNG